MRAGPPAVLHVLTRLDLGGAQQNTLDSVKSGQEGDLGSALAVGPGGMLDGEAKKTIGDLIMVRNLRHPISPLRDLAALVELTLLFRRRRPLLVHTHSSKAGVLGRAAAVLAGVPRIVHTVHGWSFNPTMSPPWRLFYQGLERILARWTDLLITVSEADRVEGLLLGIGRPEKYSLVRSAVDLKRFHRAGPRLSPGDFGLPGGSVLVGCLGNLKAQKDPLAFVRVAQEIAAVIPRASFVFAGDGPLRPRVEREIRERGLSGRFSLPGWIREPDRFLRGLGLYLSTAKYEGLPRAVVQALACGTPVAAFSVNGIPDLVKRDKNGWLCPPGDEKGLADAVVRILKDPRRRARYSRAAVRSVGREYDVRTMVRRLDFLYRNLLQEAGLKPRRG